MTENCRCWPTPPEYHFVYYGITEPGSAWEYNPHCPAHGDRPRWRIACINWGYDGFPHALVYLDDGIEARYERFFATYSEAWEWLDQKGALCMRAYEHIRRNRDEH